MVYVSEERVIILKKKIDTSISPAQEICVQSGQGLNSQEIVSSLGLTFAQDARGHI